MRGSGYCLTTVPASLLRFSLFGLIALAGAWVWLLWSPGKIALALGGLGLFVFAPALILAAELVLVWSFGHDTAPGVSPARLSQLVAAWRSEGSQALRVFCWRMPFRSGLFPDDVQTRRSACRGVILVHGFMCNRGLWNPWMERLRALGIPFVALNLEAMLAPIDQHADAIEAAVRQMIEATGAAPVVVGHSMGGLVVRSWLCSGNCDSLVHRVVTIGTPHQGTMLARIGLSANARQMRPGSTWLQTLADAEPPERRRRFTCFFSNCDNVVFPVSRAHLSGADNHHLPGRAHLQLLESETVFTEVLRWVAGPPSDPMAGVPEGRTSSANQQAPQASAAL